MRAMILAAGYGTRLWPLTIDRAKPAIPFMGRPLVGYVAEYVARYGCQDVIVNLHHQSASVRAALGDGSRFGVRLQYVEEPSILGTSGALDNARTLLEVEGEPFVVINGKIATDINLQEAFETHRRTGALATLVLKPNPKRERFSTVETREGLVLGFGKAPTSDNAGSASRAAQNNETAREGHAEREGDAERETKGETREGETREGDAIALGLRTGEAVEGRLSDRSALAADVPLMFTGIQILEPRIFDYIPRGIFSHTTTDVYPQAIARGERIAAHVSEGMWHELSTIQRYLEISLDLMKQQGREVEIGEGSIIETGAAVSNAVLWENVRVAEGARVHRAVLGAGVVIQSGEVVENAAVVRAELVSGSERPPKALEGEMCGANFVVPLAQ